MTRGARRPVRIRWWILVFMFLFALMSFVQRTSIAVAADTMMPVLHISQVQIGGCAVRGGGLDVDRRRPNGAASHGVKRFRRL